MSETRLANYTCTHTSRTRTKATMDEAGDPQCTVWRNAPFGEKTSHPGNVLYKYRDPAGRELWLCTKCRVDMIELYSFLQRQELAPGESGMQKPTNLILMDIFPPQARKAILAQIESERGTIHG